MTHKPESMQGRKLLEAVKRELRRVDPHGILSVARAKPRNRKMAICALCHRRVVATRKGVRAHVDDWGEPCPCRSSAE